MFKTVSCRFAFDPIRPLTSLALSAHETRKMNRDKIKNFIILRLLFINIEIL